MSGCERCGGRDHSTSGHDLAMAAAVANESPRCTHGTTLGIYCAACEPVGLRIAVALERIAAALEPKPAPKPAPIPHTCAAVSDQCFRCGKRLE